MYSSGFIDREGKWYGFKPQCHISWARRRGTTPERLVEEGWIKCSGASYVFANRRVPPTQGQVDRVFRYFKRECLSKYDLESKWEEFNYSYIVDYKVLEQF